MSDDDRDRSETLEETGARLREAAQEQSRFLDQLGDGETERALARLVGIFDDADTRAAFCALVDELAAQPCDERLNALSGATGQMRRDRRLLEMMNDIEPRKPRAEKIAAMQERIDAARNSPDDSRSKDDLEAEARAVMSRPMRIQDLVRDAEPQRWELQPGGGFIAHPSDGHTLLVQPGANGWTWRVRASAADASGTTTDPARAVAAAEAVHWLTRRR